MLVIGQRTSVFSDLFRSTNRACPVWHSYEGSRNPVYREESPRGPTQSALSHTIRGLEARLGVRLLTRTTRGVSPTEAGERLFASLECHYDGIEAGLSALNALQDKPAGTIRITAHDHAASTVLWPRLSKLLSGYPDVTIEININYGLIDIVAERFDAGVRFGDQVAKDMVAVRISPDVRMVVVGSPAYLSSRPVPKIPWDLLAHNCVNMRLPTYGGLYAWEFAKHGQELQVTVCASGRGTSYTGLRSTNKASGLAVLQSLMNFPHIGIEALPATLMR